MLMHNKSDSTLPLPCEKHFRFVNTAKTLLKKMKISQTTTVFIHGINLTSKPPHTNSTNIYDFGQIPDRKNICVVVRCLKSALIIFSSYNLLTTAKR